MKTRRVVLAFPGQGTETPGMGVALTQQFTGIKELFLQASTLLGDDLLRLLKRGGRRFEQTSVIQLALTALGLGILRELRREGVVYTHTIGHSLGELGALHAAGLFEEEGLLQLAHTRGRLMEEEALRHVGGMVVLRDMDPEQCQSLCTCAREYGVVGVAAQHGPSLWTLSGEEAAITFILRHAHATKLRTSGAWHSVLMDGAVVPFAEAVRGRLCGGWKASWIANHTGCIEDDVDAVPQFLSTQLVHRIEWLTSMKTLSALAPTDIVCCGPGKTLKGLIRLFVRKDVVFHMTEHPSLLRQTLRELSADE